MKKSVLNWLEIVSRLGLGVLFMWSSWSKINDPGAFADAVMRYEMLPECLVGIFALTLPMVELLAGLMLICTKWLREAALIVTALLAMFLTALTYAIANDLEIDCGCFGFDAGGGKKELTLAIIRDIILLAPACFLIFRRNVWIGIRGLVILVAAFIIFGVINLSRGGGTQEKQPERVTLHEAKPDVTKAKKKRIKPIRKVRPVVSKVQQNQTVEEDDDDDPEMSPADAALLEKIGKALDDEDLAAARALSSDALGSENASVRQAMVDALGWFGVKALPELTPFLADPDEDVRESAMNEWSVAVSEIEEDGAKAEVVEMAMYVLTDEDALESISGEYIGMDEKLAVESILRIIEVEGSEAGVAKAKETYEFVTGDEFVDRATAEKWIAEEYEPPETQDK